MLDTLKPGQSITCTVKSLPRAIDARDTIARLMRRDPAAQKALRKGQRLRRQNMVIYNRGNRDWVKRARCSKIVQVAPGQSWSMTFTPDLARDFKAVESYLTIS